MDAEFGGRQLKDQPAIGRVVALEGIPAEHIAQCLAQPLSLARVEEHVRANDGHGVMLRLECGISPRARTFAVTGRSSSLELASLEGHSRTLAHSAILSLGRGDWTRGRVWVMITPRASRSPDRH